MDFIYFLSLPPKLHGEAPGHRPGMAAADDLPQAPRRPGGRADGGGHGHPPEHVLRRPTAPSPGAWAAWAAWAGGDGEGRGRSCPKDGWESEAFQVWRLFRNNTHSG